MTNLSFLFTGTLKYVMEGQDMVEQCHDTVLSAMKLADKRDRPVDGLKGMSAVATLSTLDLVWGFPPDYIHCILEGVTSQLIELWLCSPGMDPAPFPDLNIADEARLPKGPCWAWELCASGCVESPAGIGQRLHILQTVGSVPVGQRNPRPEEPHRCCFHL
ncbi:uncharacterized protein LOC144094054 isoform X2 [Amblyomma americanum]